MSNWDHGSWGWSIQPSAKDCAREDPVTHAEGVICRWEIPVLRFMWQTFPETLAHHEIFLSLN